MTPNSGAGEQVRFGARSGAAPILLGAVKVALGLLFGNSLFRLLRAFPRPLLGSMLVFSGARPALTNSRLAINRHQHPELCEVWRLQYDFPAVIGCKQAGLSARRGAGVQLPRRGERARHGLHAADRGHQPGAAQRVAGLPCW